MARRLLMAGRNGCTGHKHGGDWCDAWPVRGTDRCPTHSGTTLERQKAKGQVVVELSKWGITDVTEDPGTVLLQLMTQSFTRAKLYGQLLEDAYAAAERLRGADATGELPPSVDSSTDRDRAVQDLQRIFGAGGVSTLIGNTYAADKDGGVFATGEAIRGLVNLEAQERDRAAGMAAKAIAAGLATRQVELAERQGALVADMVRALFADPELGLSAEQLQRAPVVAARHLRALGPGGAA